MCSTSITSVRCSIWLENCEVSWEAYKRSPFELCAPCSGLEDLQGGSGTDLCGGGKGHKKGRSNSQFADIPGVTYDISRYLSFVLRHGAVKEGIEMDSDGYVKVEDLLARKPHASIDSVLLAVNQCQKGRFEVHQEMVGLFGPLRGTTRSWTSATTCIAISQCRMRWTSPLYFMTHIWRLGDLSDDRGCDVATDNMCILARPIL